MREKWAYLKHTRISLQSTVKLEEVLTELSHLSFLNAQNGSERRVSLAEKEVASGRPYKVVVGPCRPAFEIEP